MVGAGYLTSNSGTAWPFDPDTADPPLDRRVSSLFADGSAILQTDQHGRKVFVSNVRVGLDGRLSFDVNIDGYDAESVDVPPSGLEYFVVRRGWCFFVVDVHAVREASKSGGLESQGPFPLDEAATSCVPDKVTSFSIYNHGKGSNDQGYTELSYSGISGDVEIIGGTNVYVGADLSVSLDDMLPDTGAFSVLGGVENAVMIAAAPGAGTGTVPCEIDIECPDEGSSGSFVPDSDGNIVLDGGDCHQISSYGNTIRITARCTPCCQCEAYKETGDRLGVQSYSVSDIYSRSVYDSRLYNEYAARFNASLCHVRPEELVVRCVALTQKIEAGVAHANRTDDIVGSIDRGQGSLVVGNESPETVSAFVAVKMSPQDIAVANIVEMVKNNGSYFSTTTRTEKANGSGAPVYVQVFNELTGEKDYSHLGMPLAEGLWLRKPCDDSNDSNDSNDSTDSTDSDDSVEPCTILVAHYRAGDKISTKMIDDCVECGVSRVLVVLEDSLSFNLSLPPGGMSSIRLYGARNSTTPSGRCTILGYVTFKWTECQDEYDDSTDSTDSADSTDSTDSADNTAGYKVLTKWFSATQEMD